jgi:hypothetical protein
MIYNHISTIATKIGSESLVIQDSSTSFLKVVVIQANCIKLNNGQKGNFSEIALCSSKLPVKTAGFV